MKLRSRKVILKKGGTIISRHDPIHFSEEKKEDFLKTNMIVGKLMKPVLQSNISQQSPSIMGGDIMDFSKIVKRNARNLQKKKDEENIKFIY